MAKFKIEVQWHYTTFDYVEYEIEADSLEEAKDKALLRATNHEGEWLDGQIIDGEYSVNDGNCKEMR